MPLASTLAIFGSLETQVNVLPVISAPLESLARAVNAVGALIFRAFAADAVTTTLETTGAGVEPGQAVRASARLTNADTNNVL